MSSLEQLMGVGVPPEVAKRAGFFVGTIEGTAPTLQGPGNAIVRLSAATLNLGSSFSPGDVVIIMPVTAGTVAAAGCGFNAGAASVANLTAGYPKLLAKINSTNWLLLAGLTAAA